MKKNNSIIMKIVSLLLCLSIIVAIPIPINAESKQDINTDLSFELNDISIDDSHPNDSEDDEISDLIVGEVIEERSEYSKTFKLKNGNNLLVEYAIPVHYQNDDGEWIDYDNSLKSDKEIVVVDKSINKDTTNDIIIDEGYTSNSEAITETWHEDDFTYYSESTSDVLSESQVEEVTLDESVAFMDNFAPITEVNNNVNTVDSEDNGAKEIDVFSSKKSNFEISFAKESTTTNMVFFSDKDQTISWGYSDINLSKAKYIDDKPEHEGNDRFTVLDNLYGKVKYESAYKDIDVELISTPIGIKENFILNKKSSKNEFISEYNIGDLSAKQLNERTIALLDSDGQVKYYISAPFMFDAKGASSKNIKMFILSNENGKLTIKLEANKSWLDDNSREYPVTIDPTFITGQQWGAVQCTFVDSSTPNVAYGYGSSTGYTGSIYTGTYGDGMNRSLIKMNSLPELNKGDIIIDATVNLFLNNGGNFFTDEYVGLYEVTSSWNQKTVTWNNQPSFTNLLIDYVKFGVNTQQNWYSWNITKLVKSWYEGTSTNNGFMLKSVDENNCVQCAQYISSNYPSTFVARPIVQITYRNNKGIEDYWTNTSFSVGKAGNVYINDYSGSFTYITSIANTASPIMAAGVNYVYNSYMAKRKVYKIDSHTYAGKGWRMNVQQTLLSSSLYGFPDNSDYKYVYTDADGTEHYFYQKEENDTKFYDEDGLGLELTFENSNKIITDKDKNKLIFNSAGYLYQIKNSDNFATTIHRTNNTIDAITDPSGNSISVLTNSADYVKNITNPDGKNVNITFGTVNNEVGYITRITKQDGTHTDYTYDNSGLMTSITDTDGYRVEISYDGTDSKKVSQVIEYGVNNTIGNKMTFDRSKYNMTVVQSSGLDGVWNNSDDIITTYQFDNFGRTKSVQSKTKSGKGLGAANYEYTAGEVNSSGSNIKYLNRVSGEHALGSNTVNYLRNHSFEVDSQWIAAAWSGTNDFTSAPVGTQKLYGNKSYCIHVNSYEGNSAGRACQDITGLIPNHKYTLSGYVKVLTFVGNSDTSGALIAASSLNTDDTWNNFYSDMISKPTDDSINNGWRRVSVTFTVPANSTKIRVNIALRAARGTVYFDGMQLEDSETPSPYNFIENGSLERYSGATPISWEGYEDVNLSSSGDSVITTQHQEGASCFRFRGEVSKVKGLVQKVPVSGTENDTYILSGWGAASSVPTNTQRKFQFSINVVYDDENQTTVVKSPARFNPTVSGWQFVSKAFNLSDGTSANKTPKEIWIYMIYSGQGNLGYFDNIQLVKEPASSYTYDEKGNLVSVVSNAKQKSSMQYNTDNKLTKVVDPKGYDYNYTYDNSTGKLKTATTQQGAKYTYTYDTKGNLKKVEGVYDSLKIKAEQTITYPNSSSTSYVVSNKDQRNNSSYETYNAKNGTLMNSTDSIGNTTTYYYNTSNNLLSSVTSGSSTVSYQYDSNYKFLTGVSTPSAIYQFTYDEFGNRTSTVVGNRTLASYTYNAGGAMTRMNYGNGNYVTYSYDNYGNVKAKALNGTQVYQGIADNSGTITKAIDKQNNLQYNYVYDSTDRLISSSVTDTGTNQSKAMYEYDFDLNNNLSKFTVLTPSGSNKTTYTYIEDNLPESTMLQNGKILTNDYDKLGRLTKAEIDTDNQISTSYSYLDSNSSGYTTTLLEKEENGDLSFKYEYDANGNITRIRRKNGSAYTASEEYTYDALGELTQVDYLDLNQRITYTYDNSGNILEEKIYTVNNGTATLTDTNTYTYGDNSWKDLLTEYNSDTFTYDSIGNPLAYRDGISFTWSNGRQLQSYSKGNTNISYTYDTNGMRLTKNVNGLQYSYLYQGGLLLQETRGTRVLDYSYDANGQPACVKYSNNNNSNGTYYYYARNSRGDIIGLYNADGTLYCTYTYDVWGNILSVKDTNNHELTAATDIANLQSLKYRGYYYDYETGLYYLQSRFYDPVTHRFVNFDKTESIIYSVSDVYNKNLIAYCDNNPLSRIDEDGEFWHLVIGTIVGGFVGGIVTAVEIVSESGFEALGQGETWGKIGISALCGSASGLAAASGIGIGGSIAIGGIAGGAESFGHAMIDTNGNLTKDNIINIAIDSAAGALGGAIGGKGVSHGDKYLQYYNDKLFKKPIGSVLGKSGEYYSKMTSNYTKKLVKPAIKSFSKGYISAKVASSFKYTHRFAK